MTVNSWLYVAFYRATYNTVVYLRREHKQASRDGLGKGQGQIGTQTLQTKVRGYIPVSFWVVLLRNSSLCLVNLQRERIAQGGEHQAMGILVIPPAAAKYLTNTTQGEKGLFCLTFQGDTFYHEGEGRQRKSRKWGQAKKALRPACRDSLPPASLQPS